MSDENGQPAQLELRKLDLEQQRFAEDMVLGRARLELETGKLDLEKTEASRRHELERLRVKWIGGVVAVAVALISAASAVTVAQLKEISGRAALKVEQAKNASDTTLKREEQQRLFLEAFAEHAMNADLKYRRDFAFYVMTISADPVIVARWERFHGAISGQLDARLKEEAEARQMRDELVAAQDENAEKDERILALNAKLQELNREIRGETDIPFNPATTSFADPDYLKSFTEYLSENVDLQHFRPAEFLVQGASNATLGLNRPPPFDLWGNVAEVARVMEEFRKSHDAPVLIRSAYRTPEYNASVGGARSSLHLKGTAVDFSSPQGTPDEWVSILKAMQEKGFFKGGIGIHDGFVHVDVRGTNAFWDSRSGRTASTDE